MRLFIPTNAVYRISIGWERQVPKGKQLSSSNEYQLQEHKQSDIWREISSAPETVRTIDWESWENKIEDKQKQQEIRKAYESAKIAPEPVEEYQTEEQYQDTIKKAEEQAKAVEHLVKELEQEEKRLEELKQEAPQWTKQEMFDSIPGQEAEMDRQQENQSPFTPIDTENALKNYNVYENITKKQKDNNLPTIDLDIYNLLPPESPIRIAIEQDYAMYGERLKEVGIEPPALPQLLESLNSK